MRPPASHPVAPRPRPGPSPLPGRLALAAYRGAGTLVQLFAEPLLMRRERRGKEDAARRGERLGRSGLARPDGPLAWVHAASVGETLAVLPLIAWLRSRGVAVLLTTGTVSAAGVAARRLPAGAFHQYIPIDTPAAIAPFLDHWRPGLVLFAESEIWPATIAAISKRRITLVLVNARMSERSWRGWSRFAALARLVLGSVELALAQSPADAARLRALGARRVEVSGNLKFDAPPPPADPAELAALRQAIGERPVFLAASTHAGEEAAVIEAHIAVADSQPGLLTIIAPRHPERGDAVAAQIDAAGLAASRRSHGDRLDASADILLADTIGDMGHWFRLANIAFLGGSLAQRGGQNPIEPAKLGLAVLHGEHVENFRDIYAALHEAEAAVSVADGAALIAQALRLMGDAPERQRMARAARLCVESFAGALDRTTGALEPYLERLTRGVSQGA